MKAKNNLDRERLIKELTTFTPADLAIMEEQAETFYHAKKTRLKYRRSLQLALADRELVQRKPVVSVQQPPQRQRFDQITEELRKRTTVIDRFLLVVIGGPVYAAGFLAVVAGVLWVLQQIVRAAAR